MLLCSVSVKIQGIDRFICVILVLIDRSCSNWIFEFSKVNMYLVGNCLIVVQFNMYYSGRSATNKMWMPLKGLMSLLCSKRLTHF